MIESFWLSKDHRIHLKIGVNQTTGKTFISKIFILGLRYPKKLGRM